MQNLKQQITKEYTALVEIMRVVRAAGSVEVEKMYDCYDRELPRHAFDRIVTVLEKCGEVKVVEGRLNWVKGVN